jgi:hypothetical protein
MLVGGLRTTSAFPAAAVAAVTTLGSAGLDRSPASHPTSDRLSWGGWGRGETPIFA